MKKGFTLIELLAVIVILAIVALISTPMILGVIENAEHSSAKASVLGLLDAAEKYYTTQELKGVTVSGSYNCTTTSCINTSDTTKVIDVKGKTPVGTIIIGNNGQVSSTSLVIKDKYEYEVINSEITDENVITGTYTAYTLGQAVTIDSVAYHVIETSSTTKSNVTLLKDEALSNMSFDTTYGNNYETSTIKTYLNTTWKTTLGAKADLIVGDVTLIEVGTLTELWANVGETTTKGYAISSLVPGTVGYILANASDSSWLGTGFYTKTSFEDGVIVGWNSLASGYTISYDVQSASGYVTAVVPNVGNTAPVANPIHGPRPVITISKSALD